MRRQRRCRVKRRAQASIPWLGQLPMRSTFHPPCAHVQPARRSFDVAREPRHRCSPVPEAGSSGIYHVAHPDLDFRWVPRASSPVLAIAAPNPREWIGHVDERRPAAGTRRNQSRNRSHLAHHPCTSPVGRRSAREICRQDIDEPLAAATINRLCSVINSTKSARCRFERLLNQHFIGAGHT